MADEGLAAIQADWLSGTKGLPAQGLAPARAVTLWVMADEDKRTVEPYKDAAMNDMNGYDIEDLHLGMRATFSKTITEADIVLFAGVSGDNNALHINEEFAATTRFGGRIAHGFLTASVISAAVANRLPGPGTIYLSQQLNFLAPVRPGQTVHASVVVHSIDLARRRVTLDTTCRVGDLVVIEGQAVVMTTSSAKRRPAAAMPVAEVCL